MWPGSQIPHCFNCKEWTYTLVEQLTERNHSSLAVPISCTSNLTDWSQGVSLLQHKFPKFSNLCMCYEGNQLTLEQLVETELYRHQI